MDERTAGRAAGRTGGAGPADDATAGPPGGPTAGPAGGATAGPPDGPTAGPPAGVRLYDADEARAHPQLRPVHDWVSEHVGRPHPELGRKGAVCPFVPLSQRLGLVRFVLVDPAVRDESALLAAGRALRACWLGMEPRSGPHTVDKAVVLPLPGVDSAIMVRAHDRLKPEYVAEGLMLGEFYPGHPGPGLHNPDFRPLHSEVPLFVARSMVDNDLPFLAEAKYPADRRVGFIEAFLRHRARASPAALPRPRQELARARAELTR